MDGLTEAEDRQLRTVLDLLHATLGGDIVGMLMHGSAVEGGLRPDSDLDLLVMVDRPLTGSQRRVLLDGLLRTSRSAADPSLPRHLELTIVVRGDVRPWVYPPRLEFQYGDWWRAAFEAGQDTPWTSPNPDLAIVLTAARAHGRVLAGPPPEMLLDAVPRADLETALRAVVPDLLAELQDDTRNVLLTLARIARTLETGATEPKDRAAEAAASALEADGVNADVVDALRRCAAAYRGDAADHWDDGASRTAAAGAASVLVDRIKARTPAERQGVAGQ
jgi:streptomycin 3"-adenylyltransferase